MKATKREQELLAVVKELEENNERLLMDLEWEKLNNQKLVTLMALSNKGSKQSKRGTPRSKKFGTAKGGSNGQVKVKASVERDAFGSRLNSQGARMNAIIIGLIERGRYNLIIPETLSKMSGGAFTKGRFADHLRWLKRHNYL